MKKYLLVLLLLMTTAAYAQTTPVAPLADPSKGQMTTQEHAREAQLGMRMHMIECSHALAVHAKIGGAIPAKCYDILPTYDPSSLSYVDESKFKKQSTPE